MKVIHQGSFHLRSGRRDRILHNMKRPTTRISIMKYGHAYEGEKHRDSHHILHNSRNSLSYKLLNSNPLFWHTPHDRHFPLDKRLCKDHLYQSTFCKVSHAVDLVWYILHHRHHALDKRYCKDSMSKSLPILISDGCRSRETIDNYRKYSLWMRVRDYRETKKIVNCTHL